MKPKVTVIVPALNVAGYIRECMDSILSQTMRELEVLVLDADSTDGTHEIIKEYAVRDKRVRLLKDDKKSTGYAKNLGIEQAQAPYIAIVESDDYIESDMMEKLYKKAEETDADIVKGGFDTFIGQRKERLVFPKTVAQYAEDYETILKPREHVRCFRWIMFEWLGLYRKSFLEKHHIRHQETPGAAYQDIGFWFLGFSYASRVCLIPDVVYHYRYDNPDASIKRKDQVFQTCSEYAYIRENLRDKTEIWEKVYPAFCREFYHSNEVVYARLEPRLKPMLSDKMREVLVYARQEGALDEALFEEREREMLAKLLDSARIFDQEDYKKQKADEKALEILKKKCGYFPSIVIMGAGSYGANLHYVLQKAGVKVSAYADNAPSKWSSIQNGLNVYPVKTCEVIYPEGLYLVANKHYGEEIAQSLRAQGIPQGRIEVCDILSLVGNLI